MARACVALVIKKLPDTYIQTGDSQWYKLLHLKLPLITIITRIALAKARTTNL